MVDARELHLIAGLDLPRRLAAPGNGLLARRRFCFIQAAAGFDQLMLLDGCPFLHRQAAQIADDFFGFLARFVENGSGVLLRLLQSLVALALQLLELKLLAFAEFFCFPADYFRLLAFVLCREPVLFQRSDHMLHAQVLFLHFAARMLQNLGLKPETLGYGKCITSSRHTDQETIGRT
ncbi:hypothetical protein D3C73_890830 [compost metagenome]